MCKQKVIGVLLLLYIHSHKQYVKAQTPNRYDIVIDEILADPVPAVGLPGSEFIELKNVSPHSFNLLNWKLSDASNTATVSIPYLLDPDSFVVICPLSSMQAFNNYGATIGVNNFPSLNNDQDVISLVSPEGKLIHAVAYNTSWFKNALKSEGGWTLEMIDPRNPCSSNENWKACIDAKGGTPCKRNSVDGLNQDHQVPSLKRCYVLDNVTIVAVFDESLDSNSATIADHYLLDNGIGKPIRIQALPPLFKEVELELPVSMRTGLVYQLSVWGITDCSNNLLRQMNKCPVGIPEEADSLDIVINEVLFNPPRDGFDYVEILNRSMKIIDASKIYIANRSASGLISSIIKISDVPYLVFPGDHITVSENIEKIQQQYLSKNPGWLIQMNSLPSFPDDKGTIVLINLQGKPIDELNYDENWHFGLINNKEGISLERIDPAKPAQMRNNWTSAASTAGFGTPTYQNSQFRQSVSSAGTIAIQPAVFSPDNDGYNDLCFINYELAEPNYVANVLIFDVNGRQIRRLYANSTLSQKGYLTWDGLGENGKELRPGIYVIYTEVFNLSGKAKRFKNAVTLAKKF